MKSSKLLPSLGVFVFVTLGLFGAVNESIACTASLRCSDGSDVACEGTTTCFSGINYVECDGDQSASCGSEEQD